MFTNQSCKPSLNFSFSIWFCNFDGKRKKKSHFEQLRRNIQMGSPGRDPRLDFSANGQIHMSLVLPC